MKIHILPVAQRFQPKTRGVKAPPHNDDWDVEVDFHQWLLKREHLVTARPEEADWDYLPVYWNRHWHRVCAGQSADLQGEILRLVSRNRPTFTVCEYDVMTMYDYDLCGMVVATASRQGDEGLDIPLLCKAHRPMGTGKRWLASFVGKFQTHPIRAEMARWLQERRDIFIQDGNLGTAGFVELLCESYIALCPRGHGGQTFRFYEAMQLGIVPYLIGEPDARPFPAAIDWAACSLYVPTVEALDLHHDLDTLLAMGQQAQETYVDHLAYGRWCRHLLEALPCS